MPDRVFTRVRQRCPRRVGGSPLSQTQVARRFGTYAKPYWGRVTFRWDSDYSKEIDREYRI